MPSFVLLNQNTTVRIIQNDLNQCVNSSFQAFGFHDSIQ